MRITRNKVVLDLRPGSEVPLTLANPLFNNTGSFSYPFETPATPAVLSALGFPNRPDRHHRYLNKAPATLEHGLLRLSGKHNITSVSVNSSKSSDSITNDFIADEGAFYDEIGDRMLAEVMRSKLIPPDSSNSSTSLNDKYIWLHQQLQSSNSLNSLNSLNSFDFCAFPCCIATEEIEGGTNYIFLNKTDSAGNILLGRTGPDNTGDVNPDGVAPFLFVRTVIREIFDYYKLDVVANPFVENTELQLAVVLNNTVDALVPGFVDYAELVPNVTVNTFIKTIEAQFGCKFFINYRLRTVHIIHLSEIFTDHSSPSSQTPQNPANPANPSNLGNLGNPGNPGKDFTSKLSSPITLGYDDPQKLVLSVGKSFSRSAVVGDSYDQVLSETNAQNFNLKYEDAIHQKNNFVRNVMYADNRNNFYITEFDRETTEYLNPDRRRPLEIINWSYFYYKFISSPFFDYRGAGNLQEYAIENNAESVNTICAHDDSTDYVHIDVPFFEADTRRLHPVTTQDNIPLIDGYGNKDCPLSFVIVRGWVTVNYTVYPHPSTEPSYDDVRYLFASSFTTHPVADIESPGIPHVINLTPCDIRDLWYSQFEDFLRRANVSASCTIEFNAIDINNIRWWEKIWLNGQPYFIDKINLTLSGDADIRIDSVELRTARLFADAS